MSRFTKDSYGQIYMTMEDGSVRKVGKEVDGRIYPLPRLRKKDRKALKCMVSVEASEILTECASS